MYNVVQTKTFERWLDGLRDQRAQARIAARLLQVAAGNLGDHKTVGDRVSELRIAYGPGYRLYFTVRKQVVVVLLAGGDKHTQERDIRRARALATNLKDEDLP